MLSCLILTTLTMSPRKLRVERGKSPRMKSKNWPKSSKTLRWMMTRMMVVMG